VAAVAKAFGYENCKLTVAKIEAGQIRAGLM
jgi:hypothetical protein